jgi:glucose-6-phosphate isomerase
MALRGGSKKGVVVDGQDVDRDVSESLAKLTSFTDRVRSGEHTGATGKTITHVVNIGIGGSDLGPVMVVEALKPYVSAVTPLFVSNVDGSHIHDILNREDVRPETTLFIIASKTFTTQETLLNAKTARTWLVK